MLDTRRIAFGILVMVTCLVGQAQEFNILDYGAKADGKTVNTTMIQSAIEAAHFVGGGKVIIPQGEFVSGSLVMKSGVTLHVEEGATLLGSTNAARWISRL